MPPETETALSPGARVRALRERAGLTQYDLAARLEISQPRYHRIEAGDGRPTFALVCRLAAAIGCEPRDIDPEVGDLAIPAGALCLRPDPDLKGSFLPHRPADAGRLAEMGWPEAVGHRKIAELTRAAKAAGLAGVYFLP